MLKTGKILLLILLTCNGLSAQTASKPFPQHSIYTKGAILPNHLTQKSLDNSTLNFYWQWKNRYVKQAADKSQSYIWFERPGNKQCVSEGQGYGMIIIALMAGADRSAKTVYDALFRYYQLHPARKGQYLMAWAQNKNGVSTDRSSATDGDMDIAYSLLLANKQWGSRGNINYLKSAKLLIADIMKHEINRQQFTILLGNDVEADSEDYFDTRTSDFMPSHLKAFRAATGDVRWDKVTGNTYRLFTRMQQKYSPDASLVPDFIQQVHKNPHPAKPMYLESKYDGCYNYNACRVPWRIAADYLLYGDERAKLITTKINRWIRSTSSDNPDNISAGYTLAGNDLPTRHFEALSFIAPFAVAAMTDSKNQQWLNHTWDYLLHFKLKDYDYYDNSIKMLNMIILSGNYWKV